MIVPQMVLMGLGMGLISTPATESILLVLPPARAGVGSARQRRDPRARRHARGRRGALLLFSSVYAAHAHPPGAFGHLPAPAVAAGKDSVGAAVTIAREARPLSSRRSATRSWPGSTPGSVLVAVVCLVGAVAALLFLPGRLPAQVVSEAASLEAGLARVGLTWSCVCQRSVG